MSQNRELPGTRVEIIQRRFLALQLHADLAYFQARTALIGEPPRTTNQEAQKRAFKLLHQALGQQLIHTKGG